METVRAAIYDILEAQNPANIRGLFYALETRGFIAKTEAEYKSTVVRLTGQMRREGTLPFSWLADSTRWMRKPRTYSSIEEVLNNTAATYRRQMWATQDAYVEVWLEKDALSGVLYPVTAEWDVPLMVTRGYASLSFLHTAAETISNVVTPTHIYYLGDHDPSGVDISRKVEADLRGFAPSADITFTRLAVNADQIEEMGLPTRPTKTSDSRSKRFRGRSVELDAIPAPILRQMVERAITSHVDDDQLHLLEVAEQEERQILTRIAASIGGDR